MTSVEVSKTPFCFFHVFSSSVHELDTCFLHNACYVASQLLVIYPRVIRFKIDEFEPSCSFKVSSCHRHGHRAGFVR